MICTEAHSRTGRTRRSVADILVLFFLRGFGGAGSGGAGSGGAGCGGAGCGGGSKC